MACIGPNSGVPPLTSVQTDFNTGYNANALARGITGLCQRWLSVPSSHDNCHAATWHPKPLVFKRRCCALDCPLRAAIDKHE